MLICALFFPVFACVSASLLLNKEFLAAVFALIATAFCLALFSRLNQKFENNHKGAFWKILAVVWALWTVLVFYCEFIYTSPDEQLDDTSSVTSASTVSASRENAGETTVTKSSAKTTKKKSSVTAVTSTSSEPEATTTTATSDVTTTQTSTSTATTVTKNTTDTETEKEQTTSKTTTATKRSATTADSYADAPQTIYVLNPESMKIHLTGCRTLKHYENFIETDDLEAALSEGYTYCKVCMK